MTRIPFRRPPAEKLLFWLLLLLLAWAPIPLGSHRGWAWALLEVSVYLLVGAWLALWSLGKATVSEPLRRSWPLFALLGAWVALQALHVVPLPAGWVAALSPESARMHALAAPLAGEAAWITLSVEPHASLAALLKTLAYVGVFFLVLALACNRDRVRNLARFLVAVAVVQSVVAVALHLAGATGTYFDTPMQHAASASGTFANRNHFAGYLEMMLALGIGLLLAGVSDARIESWRHFATMTLEWILSPKMVLRLALCVLVIALTSTHSRMGNTAFFASLLVAGLIGIVLARRATRGTVVLLASLVVIDLLIVGSWFGVERLAQRIEQTTMAEVEEREDPARHTAKIIADYPLFGTGPGTFYVTFPRYRPAKVAYFFDHAHNDYAQFAAESGLAGLAFLGAFVLTAMGAALWAQWRRRDPLMRGMAFSSVMAALAILIHSWLDFNLQIPANAALFMVMLALGWIACFLDRQQQ